MVVQQFLAEFITIAVIIVAAGAELLHMRRVKNLSRLAFGRSGRPAFWARTTPALRVVCIGLICWGLISLLLIKPKTHNESQVNESKQRHLVILLDVSPSMRLQDAGKTKDMSRMKRAREVVESLFDRVPVQQYKLSVIAFFNDAIPVVMDTNDLEVVKNTLNDLPMHYAFTGNNRKTDMFKALKKAAELTKTWQPKSTILLIISDGDTVPASGMPKLPISIADTLIVGIGDAVTGKFIEGRNSRQDVSTLRQVASRLNGEFHNGNEKHIASSVIQKITRETTKRRWEDLGRREYALLAITIGSGLLAIWPLLLHYFGTTYHPGVRQETYKEKIYTRREKQHSSVV